MSDLLFRIDKNMNLSCLKYSEGDCYFDGNSDYDLDKFGSALEVLEHSLENGYSAEQSILLGLKVLKNDFTTYERRK